MCCEGSCQCGRSPANNLYRGEPNGSEMCQCEPVEEACMDPEVSIVLDCGLASYMV